MFIFHMLLQVVVFPLLQVLAVASAALMLYVWFIMKMDRRRYHREFVAYRLNLSRSA